MTAAGGNPNSEWRPDPLMPVASLRREVQARYDRLNLNVPFCALLQHARQRWWQGINVGVFQPTFIQIYQPENASTPRGPTATRRAQFGRNEVCALERALDICEQASAPIAQPLYGLLHDGYAYCIRFDELEREARQFDQEVRARCRRGGIARQARLEPVRAFAAELIRSKAPQGGWRDPRHAAQAISEDLMGFIVNTRVSMFAIEETLVRTVVRWIRDVESLRIAFDAHARRLPT